VLLDKRARQLLDKEEALVSLEQQLLAKQEALYWRERCLRSEHFATTTTAANTPAMPPLIQIRPPGIVGLQQRGIVGMDRRPRVTVTYQPERPLQPTHKQVQVPQFKDIL